MTNQNKISVLQVGPLPDFAAVGLNDRFAVVECKDETEALMLSAKLREIRGIATTGKAAIGAKLLDALPALRIVSCLGAGTDGIDTDAADARGVLLATTSHVLAADVADVAIGLMIVLARDLLGADRFVRSGDWMRGRYPLGRSLRGARLGIVGLGAIGSAVARRAEAFEMEIAYHTRNIAAGSPYGHVADLADLAGWCDFLTLCCPGGAQTHRLVDARILHALGPKGVLVNVSRGSVVDEAALADAVSSGTIGGAGLDVFENEPRPHPALLASPRVILLPHIGSATGETRLSMAAAMVGALERELCLGSRLTDRR